MFTVNFINILFSKQTSFYVRLKYIKCKGYRQHNFMFDEHEQTKKSLYT